MAKFKLPWGVVVETSEEVGSRIFGATAVDGGSKSPAKKAAAKKTPTKPDTKTDSSE